MKTKVLVTLVAAIIGVPIGYYVSQYMPLWGGFLTLGTPFSPARLRLAPGHMVAFAFVFGCVGYVIAHQMAKGGQKLGTEGDAKKDESE